MSGTESLTNPNVSLFGVEMLCVKTLSIWQGVHVLCCVQVLREKSDLQARLHSLRDMVHGLEEELQDSTNALAASQQEGRQLQSRLVQLQAVVEASEKARQQQRKSVHQQVSGEAKELAMHG